MIVVLLGPPGAGKGTQALGLAGRLGLVHVASGDLFREAMAAGTPLGQEARQYMERGELVPDTLAVGMVLERIARPDCQAGVVLDGFPRTAAQAESLDEALAAQGKQVDAVLLLAVSAEVVLERLTGRRICRDCQAPYHVVFNPPARAGICDRCGGALYQRDDDRDETVRRRLQVYQAQTAPLISYYRQRGLLREVDGAGDLEAVATRLVQALDRGAIRPWA